MDSLWQDGWLICGRKGVGKSRLARWVWARADPGQTGVKLCIDPMGDADPPGATTFTSLAQIPWEARVLRYVPPLRGAGRQLAELSEAILERGRVLTWWDEYDQLGDSQTASDEHRALILRGRHRQCGNIACCPRPANIFRSYLSLVDHLVMFQTTDPDDIERFARRAQIPWREAQQLVSSLSGHGYAWYHARQHQTYVLDAIPA